MSELMKELERRIEAAWMVEPQDVRRMLSHNTDEDRNFSQWVYAYMDLWQLMNVLYSFYKICLGGKADLDTMKATSNAVIGTVAANCKSCKMEDTMSVLYRSMSAVNGCSDLVELAKLLREVQRFVNIMFYNVDLALPWDGMSKASVELQKEYVPVSRIGAVDVSDK